MHTIKQILKSYFFFKIFCIGIGDRFVDIFSTHNVPPTARIVVRFITLTYEVVHFTTHEASWIDISNAKWESTTYCSSVVHHTI